MTNIYRAKDLAELFDRITTNSIGLDRTIQNFWESTNSSYPPFNIIQENNHEFTLEIALAGFKKKEVKVYTEHGKLIVEGRKKRRKRMSMFIVVWLKDHFKEGGNLLMM